MILGGWVFVVSEVPLYIQGRGGGREVDAVAEVQGLLEIKNTHRPRTLL